MKLQIVYTIATKIIQIIINYFSVCVMFQKKVISMLKIMNLNKSFCGQKIIDNVSFKVHKGEILGLIGQNGAGKTTTFHMILNLLKPDSGSIIWNNSKITIKDLNEIGFLPEERGLYQNQTIEQQIIFFASLKGKNKREIINEIPTWMEKLQVKGKITDKINTLSKGNQQKVQLISTLIYNPKLVILDEPFSGLDPINTNLLITCIKELRKKGAIVIYSSHDMSNVEKISDQIVMLKNGKVVLNGTIDEIRNHYGNSVFFIKSNLNVKKVENISGIKIIETKGNLIKFSTEKLGLEKVVLKKAIKYGDLYEFYKERPTLEDIFRRVTYFN